MHIGEERGYVGSPGMREIRKEGVGGGRGGSFWGVMRVVNVECSEGRGEGC